MSKRIEAAPLPRIAATYARVSTVKQDTLDKTSLDTQEAGCVRWARANDWIVDERFTYRDHHTGEELWERQALTRLREAARARQFGVLVCHLIDRLSRDPIHLGILLDELTRLGIPVQFVTEELDDSPEATLIRFIKGYAGKVENERRRERSMRATHERVARGLPIATGRAPYGYRWADERKTGFVVNPITAPIVVRMFTEYATGTTLRKLAASLTADGIPTPTGRRAHWDPAVVRAILLSSIYWGEPVTLKSRAEKVPLDYRAQYSRKSRTVMRPLEEQTALPSTVAPPLVSSALAAEAQRRLRLNQQLASRSAKDPESALLRGLTHCGLCGGTMYANRREARARKDGSVPTRYCCQNAWRVKADAAHGRYCTPHTINGALLDAAVWGKVAAILCDPDLIRQELEHMREVDPPGTADLAALDHQILALEGRISGLIETAQYATDSDARRDLAGQIDVLTRQKRNTEAERAKMARLAAAWERDQARLETLTQQPAHTEAELARWGYAEKRAALLALKASVTVYPPGRTPRAELTIQLPLRGPVTLALGDGSSYDMYSWNSLGRGLFSAFK